MASQQTRPSPEQGLLQRSPYTFDKVIRMIIGALVLTGLILLIRHLSNVLVPFFIAVLLAYLIDPMVCFVQKKMRVKHRGLSVFLSLLVFTMVLSRVLLCLISQFIEEMQKMAFLIKSYLQNTSYQDILPERIDEWLRDFLAQQDLQRLFNTSDITETLQDLSRPL
ncbi:MAG: AI-2E family transporter, partial [Marinilabilia sp.]